MVATGCCFSCPNAYWNWAVSLSCSSLLVFSPSKQQEARAPMFTPRENSRQAALRAQLPITLLGGQHGLSSQLRCWEAKTLAQLAVNSARRPVQAQLAVTPLGGQCRLSSRLQRWEASAGSAHAYTAGKPVRAQLLITPLGGLTFAAGVFSFRLNLHSVHITKEMAGNGTEKCKDAKCPRVWESYFLCGWTCIYRESDLLT